MHLLVRDPMRICAIACAIAFALPVQHVSAQTLPSDALAQEVAELRARVDQLSQGSAGACYPSGWYGGAELVLVKPYFEEGVLSSPSYNLQTSPRFWLGCQSASGLGWRVRYWNFDHSAESFVDPTDGLEQHSLEAHVLDFDITQFLSFGGFEVTAAGGVRYARFNADSSDATNGTINTDFEGLGPTLALDMRRPLGCGFALIANGRTSVLYGHTALQRTGTFTSATTAEDDLALSLEAQTGIEYALQLRGGRRLAFRTLMEGQLWGMAFEQPDDVSPLAAEPGHDDMGGFFGLTLGLGYTW